MNVHRPRWAKPAVAAIVLGALAFLLRKPWLTVIGAALITAQPPAKADIAVVLAGDFSGERILRAANLAAAGYVPRVLISGQNGPFDGQEANLAIAFAVRKGHPESIFIPATNLARSTREEAAALTPILRRLGARRVLLITSDFHTARAVRLFRRAAPDLEFAAVASPASAFDPADWWKSREGRKTVLLEWIKTVTEPFGI